MQAWGAYAVSALWRHTVHRWIYGAAVAGLIVLGGSVSLLTGNAGLALGVMDAGLGGLLLALGWEWGAQQWARHRGFRVLYVLPSPSTWVARRLRRLGYSGPVATRLWEMHVNERERWTVIRDPARAVQAFRQAYTADRLRWLRERPDDVGLIICTFNRLPAAEWAALAQAGAWRVAAPLDPRIPPVVTPRRQRTTQLRMFGAVVSSRNRRHPATWTTIYVPPRATGSHG
uniref:Uncharacterized protein n=1 Tax=Sulfobacillus thermotolerans TaxID=338644 RepID=G5CJ63_9FIRM|nr:hypothetical protein [Sulfobacillus thermotolerans]AEP14340.1 hypothetical protein [Sulfobacillus thermotolerans]